MSRLRTNVQVATMPSMPFDPSKAGRPWTVPVRVSAPSGVSGMTAEEKALYDELEAEAKGTSAAAARPSTQAICISRARTSSIECCSIQTARRTCCTSCTGCAAAGGSPGPGAAADPRPTTRDELWGPLLLLVILVLLVRPAGLFTRGGRTVERV